MYLCYSDESGDSGYAAQGSPSNAFVLSAILLRDSDWSDLLERMKAMRGYFYQEYGISRRAELKANHLIHKKGVFKMLPVSLKDRMKMFEYAMRLLGKDPRFTVFAVLVDKGRVKKPESIDPREQAWKLLIERVDNFTGRQRETVMLFPDKGHGFFIRNMVRRMRRFHRVASAFEPGAFLEADAKKFVEDPSDRDSQDSYFIQMADMVAYAALRAVHPDSRIDGSYWEWVGDSRLLDVNKIRGGPPGIKVFPT